MSYLIACCLACHHVVSSDQPRHYYGGGNPILPDGAGWYHDTCLPAGLAECSCCWDLEEKVYLEAHEVCRACLQEPEMMADYKAEKAAELRAEQIKEEGK